MNFSMSKLGFSSQSKSDSVELEEMVGEGECCECGSSGELAALAAESVSDSILCVAALVSLEVEVDVFGALDANVRKLVLDGLNTGRDREDLDEL